MRSPLHEPQAVQRGLLWWRRADRCIEHARPQTGLHGDLPERRRYMALRAFDDIERPTPDRTKRVYAVILYGNAAESAGPGRWNEQIGERLQFDVSPLRQDPCELRQ